MSHSEATHPCFSIVAARAFARLHLPVAPACNITCAYCNRKYDCVNESRPGVTSAVLTADAAFQRYRDMLPRVKNLRIVGIAGPGDALANADATFATFRLIREVDDDIDFCLSTNGTKLVDHIDALRDLRVRYLTVTVNTRRLETARSLYLSARCDGTKIDGVDAARFVLERQEEGLAALRPLGLHLKINTVLIPGINDAEIEEIAGYAKASGAEWVNIMPLIPTSGTTLSNFAMVSRAALTKTQDAAAKILPVMRHCSQCRADAVGSVLSDRPSFVHHDAVHGLPRCSRTGEAATASGVRRRVAVTSRSGHYIDLHFGHADSLLVYDVSEGGSTFVERRVIAKYCPGPDDCVDADDRTPGALAQLHDCDALLSLRIGDAPRRAMEAIGVTVLMTCDAVEAALRDTHTRLENRPTRE